MAARTVFAGAALGGLAQPVAELVTNACLWLGAPEDVCRPLGVIAGIMTGVAIAGFVPRLGMTQTLTLEQTSDNPPPPPSTPPSTLRSTSG